jgi:hypothetical protein
VPVHQIEYRSQIDGHEPTAIAAQKALTGRDQEITDQEVLDASFLAKIVLLI